MRNFDSAHERKRKVFEVVDERARGSTHFQEGNGRSDVHVGVEGYDPERPHFF